MKTPERTTADVFPRYLGGEVVADSATLKWPGLFVRRYRFARVVDGFLVPATAEPLVACIIAGSADFQEREIGGAPGYPAASGVATCSSPGRRPLTNCAGTHLWEQNWRLSTFTLRWISSPQRWKQSIKTRPLL
ncbi:MAG: hypothetical protein WCA06_02405 [Terrimicrobiaceae bacterium]